MNVTRIRKLIDQLNDELESASLHYDMDEVLDGYHAFMADMETLLETADEDDDK